MSAPTTPRRQARFWRKFLRLTRGRVTVLRALDVIAMEEEDESARAAVLSLRADVIDGLTLSEALAKRRPEFSLSVVELVKTAEKTGAWDEILEEIAGGIEDGTFD